MRSSTAAGLLLLMFVSFAGCGGDQKPLTVTREVTVTETVTERITRTAPDSGLAEEAPPAEEAPGETVQAEPPADGGAASETGGSGRVISPESGKKYPAGTECGTNKDGEPECTYPDGTKEYDYPPPK